MEEAACPAVGPGRRRGEPGGETVGGAGKEKWAAPWPGLAKGKRAGGAEGPRGGPG